MATQVSRVFAACLLALNSVLAEPQVVSGVTQSTLDEPQFDPEWNLKRNCPDLLVLRDKNSKVVWFSHEQMKKMAIVKVVPEMPATARMARIEGTVVLNACVGANGLPRNIWAISGHPMLIPSAIYAASKWRFKPYRIKSKPIGFAGTLRFTFSSSKGNSY